MSSIRVRFAPSPTGTLHVGGARTALFNWLYARAQKGVFVLRIEDTDQERSTDESHQQILRAMDWLGLDYDEGPGKRGEFGPYIQSERLPIYQEYTQRLLDEGLAYKDYSTPEEDAARKKKLEEKGVLSAEDWPYRELSTEQQEELEAQGRIATIRVKMPDDGVVRWTDLVHGDMEFQYAVLEDWIAVKSDGFPTYNFACVVDDGLMQISHVLRGDDHVSNTPRQIHLFKELGFRVPKFGHMPMILGPDKKRLSKRHGAASVEEFRDDHWLSEAVVNYLALLGWSPGNDQEFFTVDQIAVKSDGFPTYNFACVVDDGLMEISHVLRGDDHVSNTPRQIHLFKELGFRVPKFGHMPMILGPDKKRLSKRHGAASVEEFRDDHWLSEAVVNYLALLGWSPGNDQEFFTVDQIIKKFSLKRLNNTAAVFDYEKARHLNGEHMKAMKPGQKTDIAFGILSDAGVVADGAEKSRLGKILGLLGNRFSHFDRTVPHLSAYFSDEYPVDAEVAAEVDDAMRGRMNSLADRFASLDPFDAASAEAALRALAEENGEKAGAYIHPARFAISGSGSGPSLFDAMEVLGQERVVHRLREPRLA